MRRASRIWKATVPSASTTAGSGLVDVATDATSASMAPRRAPLVRALITPDYIRAFVPGVHAATLSGRLIAHLIANKMGTPTLGMLDVELASKTQVFRAAAGMDERLSETFGIPAAVLALERS